MPATSADSTQQLAQHVRNAIVEEDMVEAIELLTELHATAKNWENIVAEQWIDRPASARFLSRVVAAAWIAEAPLQGRPVHLTWLWLGEQERAQRFGRIREFGQALMQETADQPSRNTAIFLFRVAESVGVEHPALAKSFADCAANCPEARERLQSERAGKFISLGAHLDGLPQELRTAWNRHLHPSAGDWDVDGLIELAGQTISHTGPGWAGFNAAKRLLPPEVWAAVHDAHLQPFDRVPSSQPTSLPEAARSGGGWRFPVWAKVIAVLVVIRIAFVVLGWRDSPAGVTPSQWTGEMLVEMRDKAVRERPLLLDADDYGTLDGSLISAYQDLKRLGTDEIDQVLQDHGLAKDRIAIFRLLIYLVRDPDISWKEVSRVKPAAERLLPPPHAERLSLEIKVRRYEDSVRD